MKSKLKPDDQTKMGEMLDKHIKRHMKQTGQSSTSLSWRLTQRLQITFVFLANKFKAAAGDSLVKKDRRDRHKSSYGKHSKRDYPRDAPFMRKAARLPKCYVRVRRLHLKRGRRYDASKYMKNLPRSKLPQTSAPEKEKSGEKRKRIIESSSSSSSDDEEEKITNGSAVSTNVEKKIVDTDEENVPIKKPKVEVEEKDEKPKSSNQASNLFDMMMKREKDKSSAGPPSKRSSTDSRESSPKPKREKEDSKASMKIESDRKSTESRESSPKPKAEKEDSKPKPMVTDLTAKPVTKPEKDKQKSGSSSSRDEKKSKPSKNGKILKLLEVITRRSKNRNCDNSCSGKFESMNRNLRPVHK